MSYHSTWHKRAILPWMKKGAIALPTIHKNKLLFYMNIIYLSPNFLHWCKIEWRILSHHARYQEIHESQGQ